MSSVAPSHGMPAALLIEAEESGVRLEMMEGVGVWEAMPLPRHTKATQRIFDSIRRVDGSDCACFRMQNVYVRFAESSFKRPDIAIWCREPDEEDEAVTLLPVAVIEVISKGSERKDLELNPGFYLRHGVQDYLVFDPFTGAVIHHPLVGPVRRHDSPVEIALATGCVVAFPPVAA